jgi:F-type H+-transporting ATPase subunit b
MASGLETTSAHTEVPASHDTGHGGGNSSAISGSMFFWFLVVFGLAAFILKKYAFGPILEGLDAREAEIERSLENADRLEREMLTLDETVSSKLEEADSKVRDMIEHGRSAAREAGQVIEEKAREEAQILRENAQRDLISAKGKAENELRQHSAETAVAMAARLLNEKLDDKSRKELTDRLIAEV